WIIACAPSRRVISYRKSIPQILKGCLESVGSQSGDDLRQNIGGNQGPGTAPRKLRLVADVASRPTDHADRPDLLLPATKFLGSLAVIFLLDQSVDLIEQLVEGIVVDPGL